MFCFFGIDIREQEKYEKIIQTFVDKTVNDQRYKIKFENRVKDFFIKQNIDFRFLNKNTFYSSKHFFKIPKNLIVLAFFLPKQILRNMDMLPQKPKINTST